MVHPLLCSPAQTFLPLRHENAAGETQDGLSLDSVINPEKYTLALFGEYEGG
jgi:hypothetical protein